MPVRLTDDAKVKHEKCDSRMIIDYCRLYSFVNVYKRLYRSKKNLKNG